MRDNITLAGYLEELSSSSSVPGGGSAAAVVNSFACGLMLMSLRIAVLKKEPDNRSGLSFEDKLIELQRTSFELSAQDSDSFSRVMKLWVRGGSGLTEALIEAARVSIRISGAALELLNLIGGQDLSHYRNIITDVALAARFAGACYEGGMMNYRVNMKLADCGESVELAKEKEFLGDRFAELYPAVLSGIERLAGEI